MYHVANTYACFASCESSKKHQHYTLFTNTLTLRPANNMNPKAIQSHGSATNDLPPNQPAGEAVDSGASVKGGGDVVDAVTVAVLEVMP